MHRALFATLVLSLCLGDAAVASAQRKPSSSSAAKGGAVATGQVVNLNTATATQIATLPGIGEKAAKLIIEYRDKNGGFKKIEELMNVKGIGEKSFLKLKPLITVGDARPATK
jgi:competence protein ComEA